MSAILTARGDGLAITPTTLPDGMEGVGYQQFFTATGGSDNYSWYTVPATWRTAECTYAVTANETPLWEGRDQRGNGNVEYTLPFTFPFGSRLIDKVYVSSVGFILFKDDDIDNHGIYNSALYYRNGIAPFWCDALNVEAYVDTNVTVPEGEGYVTYRVKVREDAPGNVRIDNSANIVFDYNDPIVTDPAWWNTVYEMTTIPVTVDGVTTNMRFVVGEPYGELPVPAARDGWTFEGWFTGPNGTGRRVTAETIVQAGDRLYDYWKAVHRLYGEVTGAAPTDAASVYEGYLVNTNDNAVMGTIQVKVGKPNKKTGLAAVKATVVGLDGKKKTLKAAEKGKAAIAADGPTTVALVGGDACEVVLGTKGMSGTYGNYAIHGALNVFTSKNAADKAAAAAVLAKWKGVVNIAWQGAQGWNGLSVTIAAKGKVKVAGTLADGAKVSAKGQLIVGEEWCCAPVVYAKKGVKLAFNVWLPRTQGEGALPTVIGLGEEMKVGKPGTLKGDATFKLDAAMGDAKYEAYLPNGVAVGGGAKWTLPKAGKVQLAKDGTVDEAKLGENPSALKLTYKAKDGTFKGAFKVYADAKGKLKTTTVKVTGVLVNGTGYGTAVIKKVSSVGVRVE